jgi:hypothetical protein
MRASKGKVKKSSANCVRDAFTFPVSARNTTRGGRFAVDFEQRPRCPDGFARTEKASVRRRETHSWQWSYEGSEPHANIGYEANLVDPDAAWLRLTYTARGNPMDYRVRLVTTQPTYDGRRWWFLCPLARKGGRCPARGHAEFYQTRARANVAALVALP